MLIGPNRRRGRCPRAPTSSGPMPPGYEPRPLNHSYQPRPPNPSTPPKKEKRKRKTEKKTLRAEPVQGTGGTREIAGAVCRQGPAGRPSHRAGRTLNPETYTLHLNLHPETFNAGAEKLRSDAFSPRRCFSPPFHLHLAPCTLHPEP